jgi:hypothetical protein
MHRFRIFGNSFRHFFIVPQRCRTAYRTAACPRICRLDKRSQQAPPFTLSRVLPPSALLPARAAPARCAAPSLPLRGIFDLRCQPLMHPTESPTERRAGISLHPVGPRISRARRCMRHSSMLARRPALELLSRNRPLGEMYLRPLVYPETSIEKRLTYLRSSVFIRGLFAFLIFHSRPCLTVNPLTSA